MRLTLTLLRCPDTVAPERRVVTGGEYNLGRGLDNDWVLPDPPRLLSKRHCLVAFHSGAWHVTDLSTNGTYLNDETSPIGHHSRPLRNGDRLVLGAYEIEAEIEEAARDDRSSWIDERHDLSRNDYPGPATSGHQIGAVDRNPFGVGSGDPGEANRSGRGGSRPADGLNPFGNDTNDEVFGGPPQPDHSPAFEDSFRPPTAIVPIPDDWDFDFSEAKPASTPPAAPPPMRPAQPLARSQPDQRTTQPSDVRSRASQPAASLPDPRRSAGGSFDPGRAEGGRGNASRADAGRTDAGRAGASQPGASQDELLLAFLRGAGAEGTRIDDPLRTMEGLGAVLRAMVSGLRQALIARLSVKGEFRIEQTMIRASGNNPLKFSPSDDDALEAMFGAGRRNGMRPAAAVAEALRDIQLHELATITAMQEAVRALLARFDPETLERQASQGGGSFGKLLNTNKTRAWDAFVSLHAETTEALSDDFDNAFGKAFARAYEQALQEMTDRDRPR